MQFGRTCTKVKPLDWSHHNPQILSWNLSCISALSPLGECVLQRAVMVRKKLTAREGRGWLSGTLFCTHFRVAFVPQDSPKPDVSHSEQLYWFKDEPNCLFPEHQLPWRDVFAIQPIKQPMNGLEGRDISWRNLIGVSLANVVTPWQLLQGLC